MSDPVLMAVLVIATGIFAQWLAWRTRLPAIILLAAGGLLIGPVLGWLPHGHEIGGVVHTIVALCVAIILFEGSLTLRLREIRGPIGVYDDWGARSKKLVVRIDQARARRAGGRRGGPGGGLRRRLRRRRRGREGRRAAVPYCRRRAGTG